MQKSGPNIFHTLIAMRTHDSNHTDPHTKIPMIRAEDTCLLTNNLLPSCLLLFTFSTATPAPEEDLYDKPMSGPPPSGKKNAPSHARHRTQHRRIPHCKRYPDMNRAHQRHRSVHHPLPCYRSAEHFGVHHRGSHVSQPGGTEQSVQVPRRYRVSNIHV